MAETESINTKNTIPLVRIKELKKELKRLVNRIVDEDDFQSTTFDETECVLSELRGLSIEELFFSKEISQHFPCHISKEIMTDPVIIASGQTYDRKCIQSHLDTGDLTCPKTKETLPDAKLIPNYLLRDIILDWRKHQGFTPPPNTTIDLQDKEELILTLEDNGKALLDSTFQKLETEAVYDKLLKNLKSESTFERKEAAKEIRRLTKAEPSSRVYFGRSQQVIRELISPLKLNNLHIHPDLQEDLMTAILNISINKENKITIIQTPMVLDFLVESLRTGTIDTRKNAACTLFSLSSESDNAKLSIVRSGALKPLLELMKDGDSSTVTDAGQALYKLCIPEENKKRAVKDGAVPVLLDKITENIHVPDFLAILAWLSSEVEAANMLSNLRTVPIMMRIIKEETTSESNKERCISILYNACIKNTHTWSELRTEETAFGTLSDLAENGTEKAKKKASALLVRISKNKAVIHHTA